MTFFKHLHPGFEKQNKKDLCLTLREQSQVNIFTNLCNVGNVKFTSFGL